MTTSRARQIVLAARPKGRGVGAGRRFIGVAEVLGALGLVLPGLLRVRPVLTPLAAAGLVIIMIGATVVMWAGGMVAVASSRSSLRSSPTAARPWRRIAIRPARRCSGAPSEHEAAFSEGTAGMRSAQSIFRQR